MVVVYSSSADVMHHFYPIRHSFIGCLLPPPEITRVFNLTRNGSVASNNYPFDAVATHTCPCGEQWPGYRLRVLSLVTCYGAFGWKPRSLDPCLPGEISRDIEQSLALQMFFFNFSLSIVESCIMDWILVHVITLQMSMCWIFPFHNFRALDNQFQTVFVQYRALIQYVTAQKQLRDSPVEQYAIFR